MRVCECRLWRASLLVHYTLLLCLFSSSAYKSVRTPLVAVSLVSEISTIFDVVGRLQVGAHPVQGPTGRNKTLGVYRGRKCMSRLLTRL